MVFSFVGYIQGQVLESTGNHQYILAHREVDGEKFLIKTINHIYPNIKDIAKLNHEFNILKKIESEGVIKPIDFIEQGNQVGIILETFAFKPLSAYLEDEKLDLKAFLKTAINITKIIEDIHSQEIIHRNIKPSNILYNSKTNQFKLINFELATELDYELQEQKNISTIEGTLSYISPEQTGRMNRPVTQSTDLYSLGVTLYEMVTTSLPFMDDDPVTLIHNHIAKIPDSPSSRNPGIPKQVSDIIMKLLSKKAEDRYRSEKGLIADLKNCLNQYTKNNVIEEFQLGVKDISTRFEIPNKLYGREKEIEKIFSLFDKMVSGTTSELLLVSGNPGIGKTALINEAHKPLSAKNGEFIDGKIDQYQRDQPYLAFSQAFSKLIERILCENDEVLNAWRDKIKNELGDLAQLIVDIIPSLEHVIGKSPEVIRLNPAEAKIRLHLLFRKFIKLFSTKEKPLILFIDDVQWSSVSLLELIKDIILTSEVSQLMLVLAYRDNEVSAGHPLLNIAEAISKQRTFATIDLHSLHEDIVTQMIRDTLLCIEETAKEFTEIIYPKTEGNPFFIKMLLKDLYQKHHLHFSSETHSWQFDQSIISTEIQATKNVVEFMIQRLEKFPKPTQEILNLAACIGNQFNLRDIAIILNKDIATIYNEIWDVVKQTIIIPLSSDYAIAREAMSAGRDMTVGLEYKFQHDRIQQAAYQLVNTEESKRNHFNIGNYFLDIYAADLEKQIIKIVSQLNKSKEFYVNPDERFSLANLNVLAGKRAIASASYKDASILFKTSLSLLSENSWQGYYDLMFEITRCYAECLYVCGEHEEADKIIKYILENVKTNLEKAEIYKLQAILFSVIGKRQESLNTSLAALRLLGVPISEHPSKLQIAYETIMAKWNRKGRGISSLLDLPVVEDRQTRLISDLIVDSMISALFVSNIQLVTFAALKIVNLTLTKGNLRASSFGYIGYASMVLGPTQSSRDYSHLAIKVLEKYNVVEHMGKTYFWYAMFLNNQHEHWKNCKPYFLKAIETSKETGDIVYLAYSYDHITPYDPTLTIEEKIKQGSKYSTPLQETGYLEIIEIRKTYQHFLYNLCGKSTNRLTMSSNDYNEEDNLKKMKDMPFYWGVAAWHSMKSQLFYLYGEYMLSLSEINEADMYLAALTGSCDYFMYCANVTLTFSALYDLFEEPKDKKLALKRIETERKRFKALADNCKESYSFHYYLAEAELARINGKKLNAINYYKKAIVAAEKYQFLDYQAMYTERLAKFWLNEEDHMLASYYMEQAVYAYEKWGATEKIKQLREKYPDLIFINRGQSEGVVPPSMTTEIQASKIDYLSLLKTSQALSEEIDINRLIAKALHIFSENAGADRSIILFKSKNNLVIKGIYDLKNKLELIQGDMELSDELLPTSVINYVVRLKVNVNCGDIEKHDTYGESNYFKYHPVLSFLCLPILHHKELIGVFYCEHSSVPDAFSDSRVETLNALLGQVSISIENAEQFKHIRNLYLSTERFVPKTVLSLLGKDNIEDVKLGDSTQLEVTALFADLRGFTSIAEVLPPMQIALLLNTYMRYMAPIIREFDGYVNQYLGDGIMALFPGKPDNALRAAIKMHTTLNSFNEEIAKNGFEAMRMGIAINYGNAILCTLGEEQRMDALVVSDVVNSASRIENLNKVYGTKILLSGIVYNKIQDKSRYLMRLTDIVRMKGKSKQTELYEILISNNNNDAVRIKEYLKQFEIAFEHYIAGDIKMALSLFEQCILNEPADKVAAILRERCITMLRDGVPSDWTGITNLINK